MPFGVNREVLLSSIHQNGGGKGKLRLKGESKCSARLTPFHHWQSQSNEINHWSEHVNSWTKNKVFPTLVLRYEDLQTKPEESFSSLLKHIGIPVDEKRLDKAIGFSSFKELSKQESEDGFAEASVKSDAFFSKGTSGQWVDELDADLALETRKKHEAVMKKFGYLDG